MADWSEASAHGNHWRAQLMKRRLAVARGNSEPSFHSPASNINGSRGPQGLPLMLFPWARSYSRSYRRALFTRELLLTGTKVPFCGCTTQTS